MWSLSATLNPNEPWTWINGHPFFPLAALLQQTHSGGWPLRRRHQQLPSEEAEDDWAWEEGTAAMLAEASQTLARITRGYQSHFVYSIHWDARGAQLTFPAAPPTLLPTHGRLLPKTGCFFTCSSILHSPELISVTQMGVLFILGVEWRRLVFISLWLHSKYAASGWRWKQLVQMLKSQTRLVVNFLPDE